MAAAFIGAVPGHSQAAFGIQDLGTTTGNKFMDDTFDGGANTDTVDYSHDPSGVIVNLSTTSATDGWGGHDTITINTVENITGSAFNDILTGDSHTNIITGGAGDDTLIGGGSGDTMDGGDGIDTVDYSATTGSVTVDLSYGTASGDGSDILSNIENITGSSHNDILTGDTHDNYLSGGDGNDTMSGGDGNDILDGGNGVDSLTGGNGADTFLFMAATITNSDNIQDFNTGQGDKIDIKDILTAYDPIHDAITDFVQITTSGSDSILKVDIDGAASGHSWQTIATILGVTGLTDEAALVASGNLVVS